jgi:uncharacterized protein YbbC (DUF1343 family)
MKNSKFTGNSRFGTNVTNMIRKVILLLGMALLLSVEIKAQMMPGLKQSAVICGADRIMELKDELKGKITGVVANPTSRSGDVHLVDKLLAEGVQVKKVFAPEHGFRGEAEAGEEIRDGKDPKTGLQVISLYGNHKKPTPEDLAGLNLIIFDIQDVGVRFYTYISTLHYVMEACAENHVPLMILDRPNPNGFYVDGPVLDSAFRSFVGMDPVPVVHGMTIGEYSSMVNGEGWLGQGRKCQLRVVPCKGWDHQTEYILPVKPSPNLPNQVSIYLYPSTCFFEGTVFSLGRGTEFPFQVYGHPDIKGDFSFTPVSIPGVSLKPVLEGKVCYGKDLRPTGVATVARERGLILEWILDAWNGYGRKEGFFIPYFNTLAGTDLLKKQIISGKSADQIRESWKPGLEKFIKIRQKYLLYPDFVQ